MLDLNGAADPIEDYLAALQLLEGAARNVDVLVPATSRSADLISYASGSNRIARTCMRCLTAMSRRPTGRPIGQGGLALGGRRA